MNTIKKVWGTATEILFEILSAAATLLLSSALLWAISELLPSNSPLAGRSFTEVLLVLWGISVLVMFIRALPFGDCRHQEGHEVTFILAPPAAKKEEG